MVLGSGIPFGQSSGGSFGSFGASSSPAFGTTMSGFGATSGPAFGGPQPPGAHFDQKPNLGAFLSNPAQTSLFGSMTQPSQPAFGSNMFGTSTPFGGSQSAFGNTNTAAFGATTLPPSAIGTPPFGAIGSQGFGGTNTPVFGSTRSPAYGDSRTQAFGFSFATPTSSAPGFSSSTPSSSFPSPHALGQSNSTFGSIPICASSPPLQCFPSGGQATMPTSGNTGFWNSAFGSQRGGSRVATYTETLAPDSFGNGKSATVVKLMSISAMPVYINKSHEELRHEDYLLGDKGGMTPAGGSGFGTSTTQSGPLNPSSVYNSSSIFSPQTPFTSTGFGIASSPFNSSSPPFWPSSSTANPFTPPSSSPSVFGQTYPPFTFGTSISTPTTSSFTFPAPSSNSTFKFTPSSSISQTGSAVGQASTSIWPTQTPFGQTNMFSTPSTGFSTTTNLFSPSSPSPSVIGHIPSPFSSQVTSAIPFSAQTSTYNSGLHNFTSSIPQTGGTFGHTSTLFGQNIFSTPTRSRTKIWIWMIGSSADPWAARMMVNDQFPFRDVTCIGSLFVKELAKVAYAYGGKKYWVIYKDDRLAEPGSSMVHFMNK